MPRSFLLPLIAAATVAAGAASAAPITIGGVTFQGGLADFPTAVATISGATQVFGGIGCEEGLTGADIDTGCFNMGSGDVLRLDYGRSFGNAAGADIYFTDGRFSDDALDFSLDGSTFFTIAAGTFVDTGVDSAIRNEGFTFDLFAAQIDLSTYGVGAGGSYSSIWLRGISQSDPIVVGLLDGVQAQVPLPAGLPLLAGGLGVLALWRRRR